MKFSAYMLKNAAVAFLLFAFSSTAHADTLDFTEIGATGRLDTELSLSNAKLKSFGSHLFIFPGDYLFADNGLGGVCAIHSYARGCAMDLEISFTNQVKDLVFDATGFDKGDHVTVSAYNADNLVHSMIITANKQVDFSAFGMIDRLFFDDDSHANGGLYLDFSFTTVSAVPLPAALPLFGAALAGIGFLGWKRKKQESI